jgi:signal peptidase I
MAWGLVVTGAVVAAVAGARRRFLVVTVEGSSMEPTYRPGDRLLVRRCSGDDVAAGVVVAFRPPPRDPSLGALPALLVKRVAAVAGDPVVAAVDPSVLQVPGPVVPPGHLLVLGDSPRSLDSKAWGYLPSSSVVGVIVRPISANEH